MHGSVWLEEVVWLATCAGMAAPVVYATIHSKRYWPNKSFFTRMSYILTFKR